MRKTKTNIGIVMILQVVHTLLTAQMLEDEALLAELQSRRELLLYEKHFQNKVRLTERRLLVVEGEAPRLQGRQTRRPRWEVQQTTMMKKNI